MLVTAMHLTPREQGRRQPLTWAKGRTAVFCRTLDDGCAVDTAMLRRVSDLLIPASTLSRNDSNIATGGTHRTYILSAMLAARLWVFLIFAMVV